MYYILNETNQIIAADDNLLSLCGASHINELSANIALGKTTFIALSDESILLNTNNDEETYSTTKTSLSSMLGNLTIVEISVPVEETKTDILDSILNDDLESPDKTEDENAEIDLESMNVSDEITFEDHLSSNDDEESLLLFEDAPIVEDVAESFTEIEKEEELFDLPSDDKTQEADEEEDQITTLDLDSEITFDDIEEKKEVDTSPILIDIEEVSKKIGIEKEDYNLFLGEYIDTALTLEKDLQSIDTEKRTNALTILSHLSDVLHIPTIGNIILDIEAASPDTVREHIESFYATLSRVTTASPTDEAIGEATELFTEPVSISEPEVSLESPMEIVEETADKIIDDAPLELFGEPAITDEPEVSLESPMEIEDTIFDDAPLELFGEPTITNESEVSIESPMEIEDEIIDDAPLELFDEPSTVNEPEASATEETKTPLSTKSFGSINLEDVKPIHFDFQLEEAANDLSLPVELIEEFVHDFIDQAHIETKKMLTAYEEGDLDAIQKIGHLLKGASSNLRINALSDTLYHIQFCEDSSELEAYIKAYWGHFLSFENQIDVISQ